MQYPNFLNNNNNSINNMMSPQPINNQFLPRTQVIRVNGEAGARNLRMAPNSSALVLDETAPIVWYAQTDGTGYLTVTPFDVSPHQAQQPINLDNLTARVAKLEEAMANVQQSNIGITKQPKKQRQQTAESVVDTAT